MIYVLAPFIGWFIAGVMKYMINQMRYGNARSLIGNGGFPSNHTTIMTTITSLIGFTEGFGPLLGLSVAVTYIVIIDAMGLRRHVGYQAKKINEISNSSLRESMGHTRFEVLGGLVLGVLIGYVLHFFISL
jgi:acid phosphatase family membrane protein YuiD